MRFLMKIFGEESVVGRFLNRLYILVVSNLLFVLFCVPVVTIGASLTALNYTLLKYRRGDRIFKVASTFWTGFRENFLRATAGFLLYLLLMIFQLLEISWCRQFAAPVSYFQVALMGLMVLETILAVYLFPVLAAFRGGPGEVLRDTLYFAFSQPLRMLGCAALTLIPPVLCFLFLEYLPLWAFLWMFFGFALVAYGVTFIMLKQFLPFLPEVDICGDIIPPGMEGDPNIMLGEAASGNDADEKTLQEMIKYGL